MKPFVHMALPVRVVFGRGRLAEAAAEAKRLGIKRPLVITTLHQAESAAGIVKETGGVAFAGAAMHTPVNVTEKAMAVLKAAGCDGTIALGGGSSTGLGKAIALHHKLCHVLGGTFDLPHAETHTVILPHATAYNAPAAEEAMRRIAQVLGTASAAQGLFDLAQKLGAPLALRDIGMPESGLDRAADIAVANPYPNPRNLERGAIRQLLDDAFHGRRPL